MPEDDDEEEEEPIEEEPVETVEFDDTRAVFSNIGKTLDGVSFAFTKMDCIGKCIGSIGVVEAYPHLREIDVSDNFIEDVGPLRSLRHLMCLSMKGNKISSIDPWQGDVFPYLIHLDLSNNALATLPPLPMKVLRTARFAKNQISSCQDFGGHSTLEELDISGNVIRSFEGITITPSLKKLDASSNELDGIAGLVSAPMLRDSNLADNKMEELVGAWEDMPDLETLRFSGCQLATTHSLGVLGKLRKLQTVDVARNPFTEADDATNPKIEVLVVNVGVKSVDGEEVSSEDVDEAEAEREKRREAELERLRQEEEARREAEGGGEDGDGDQ